MELEKAIVLSALLAQRRQNSGMALRTFHPKKRMAIAEALKGQIAVAIGGLKDEGVIDHGVVFRAARFRKASRGAANRMCQRRASNEHLQHGS